MTAEGGGRDMKKRIVRADDELCVMRRAGVPGIENGVAVRCDGTPRGYHRAGNRDAGARGQAYHE